MCSRYRLREIEDEEEGLEEILALLQRRSAGFVKAGGDVLPTDTVPVIANGRDGRRRAFAMRWGYKGPGGGLVINARSETAHEKPLFEKSMKSRRCLIPANWYYEWEQRGREKIRYAIRPTEPGVAYMAGLYRLGEGMPQAEFVILTREAAQEIAFIHPRMPVLLPGEALAAWLDPAQDGRAVLETAIERLHFGAA